MSIEAVSWALNDAPNVKAQHVSVLVVLAETADNDGTGCFPSIKTIAYKTRKSERQVNRDLAAMKDDGLIRDGDARRSSYIPVDRRPHVWDLAMDTVREDPAPWTRHPSGKSAIKTTGEPITSENNRDDTGDIPVVDNTDDRDDTDVTPVPTYPQPGCHPGQTGVTPMTDRGDTGDTQTALDPPHEVPPNPPLPRGETEDVDYIAVKLLTECIPADMRGQIPRGRKPDLINLLVEKLTAGTSVDDVRTELSRPWETKDPFRYACRRINKLVPSPDSNDDMFGAHSASGRPESESVPRWCGRCSNNTATNPAFYRRIIMNDNGTLGDMCACHPEHPSNLIKENA